MKMQQTITNCFQKELFYRLLPLILLAVSCSNDDDGPEIPSGFTAAEQGVYILNEGGFQKNNASLDYYDLTSGERYDHVFGLVNPEKDALGDTGNDILRYGSKMYVVLNYSNKVEVVDARTVQSLKTITAGQGLGQEPRYLAAYGDYVFVSAYEGTVSVIDTTSLEITKTIQVGRTPEGLAVAGDKLYVVNSGWKDAGTPAGYDRTISVIDPAGLEEEDKIEVEENSISILSNSAGKLYVASRDIYNADWTEIIKPADFYVVDPASESIKKHFGFGVNKAAMYNDRIYAVSDSYEAGKTSFLVIDTGTDEVIDDDLIAPEDLSEIQAPYGLAVDPGSGDIWITDAKDNQSPGEVFCFDSNGNKKFSFTAGVLPAKFVFY